MVQPPNYLRDQQEAQRIIQNVLATATRPLRDDRLAAATLVFIYTRYNTAAYPLIDNASARNFAMVVEGYVFGTTRQFQQADQVVLDTAIAFDL